MTQFHFNATPICDLGANRRKAAGRLAALKQRAAMNRPDPFTYASDVYQGAMRHPHKSGEAFENCQPARSGWVLVAAALAIVIAGLMALRLAGAS